VIEKNLWYGYVHVDGTQHTKRYFDSRDISEAQESDFVDIVLGPFPAIDKEQAEDLFDRMVGK
jgi:hypothetical protein